VNMIIMTSYEIVEILLHQRVFMRDQKYLEFLVAIQRRKRPLFI